MSVREELLRNRVVYERLMGISERALPNPPTFTARTEAGREEVSMRELPVRETMARMAEYFPDAPQARTEAAPYEYVRDRKETDAPRTVYSLDFPGSPPPAPAAAAEQDESGRRGLQAFPDASPPARPEEREDLLQSLRRRLEEEGRRYPQSLAEEDL